MIRSIEGRARRLGDNVNTDYIIASTRKRDTLDEAILKHYLLETIDPGFAASIGPDDLLVGGRNFGCGSAMEIAATVILAAGIRAVLATSFSRTFYRNAVNNGLIPVECPTEAIREGDRLSIALADDAITVTDVTARSTAQGPPISGIMLDILNAGGLVAYVRQSRQWLAPNAQ